MFVIIYNKFFIDTDKKKYDVVLEQSAKYISSSELAILKLGLSLHIYSPKIEMFNQMVTDKNSQNLCSVIVEVGEKITCNLKEAENYINTVRLYF